MKFLASLEGRDRILLLACALVSGLLVALLVVFSPSTEDNDPTPYSDATTTHGAKAAYLLLEQSGYRIERSHRPLSLVANEADEHTTLILAEPFFGGSKDAKESVRQFLEHGGRVLATGVSGGFVLPDNHVAPDSDFASECHASPRGFTPLAESGDVRMNPKADWNETDARQRTVYRCDDHAVVVTYPVGKGTVIWWASPLPLENSGIGRGDNIALVLRSVGPAALTHVIWDESLHGDVPSLWSYAQGTPLHLLWWQLAFVALLLIGSYARRSGPLRPDPVIIRTTPIEFVQSLGELYRKAGANNIAVAIAYQRFRHVLDQSFSISRMPLARAPELSASLVRQFGDQANKLVQDLIACEDASAIDQLSPKRALSLVQALGDHETTLRSRAHFVTKDSHLGPDSLWNSQ